MYVSYLLEKDAGMYSNSIRHPNFNLNAQTFIPPGPQYPDYSGYHHVTGINEGHPPPGPQTWNPTYAPPREEWPLYGPSTSNFGGQEYASVQPAGPGLVQPSVGQLSPNTGSSQRTNTYEWMKRSGQPATPGHVVQVHKAHTPPVQLSQLHWTENTPLLMPGGKTRTKDKYRVVYTDHQRLELEKEFHYSRYITIRRKAELAGMLSLSERQVKIWFQNRRAKERKLNKKKLQQTQQASSSSTPTPPNNMGMVTSSSGLLSPAIPMTIKEEY